MQRLELLRNKLYTAIETGSKSEILDMSMRLDKEIVKYINRGTSGKRESKIIECSSSEMITDNA